MYTNQSSSLKSGKTIATKIINALFVLFILFTLNACAKGYGCYTSTDTLETIEPVTIEFENIQDNDSLVIVCE